MLDRCARLTLPGRFRKRTILLLDRVALRALRLSPENLPVGPLRGAQGKDSDILVVGALEGHGMQTANSVGRNRNLFSPS